MMVVKKISVLENNEVTEIRYEVYDRGISISGSISGSSYDSFKTSLSESEAHELFMELKRILN